MPSIEKQNITEEIKSKESSTITDKKPSTPVVITLVEGQSGTIYCNQHTGNGIPDKLIYK